MSIKRRHLDELDRQRYFDVARAYCRNERSLTLQGGRGFEAAERGWPRSSCPYRGGLGRSLWHFGHRVGLAAIELGLVPRSIEE